MLAMAEVAAPSVRAARCNLTEMMPGPLPRLPGKPPREPIIIRRPPRPADMPEIDGSVDEEESDGEVRRPPEIPPEMPPPPRPEERARWR